MYQQFELSLLDNFVLATNSNLIRLSIVISTRYAIVHYITVILNIKTTKLTVFV